MLLHFCDWCIVIVFSAAMDMNATAADVGTTAAGKNTTAADTNTTNSGNGTVSRRKVDNDISRTNNLFMILQYKLPLFINHKYTVKLVIRDTRVQRPQFGYTNSFSYISDLT